MISTVERVYRKLRYGTTEPLGPIEVQVLSSASRCDIFFMMREVSEKTRLSVERVSGALSRLAKKRLVDHPCGCSRACTWSLTLKGIKVTSDIKGCE